MTEAAPVPSAAPVAAEPPVTGSAIGEPGWQRLHPATLLLAIVRLGPRSIHFLPALAAIGIAGKWIYVVPALGLFLLVSLVFAWLAWARFRFLVGSAEIAVASDTFARQTPNLPFWTG